jgi:hypothetical protein
MSTTVNYYHYSVYKLLLVNLTSLLIGFGQATPQLPADFDSMAWPTIRLPADTRMFKKFSDFGKTTKPANITASTLPASPSVDKPMNIHRIECAKPRDLDTAGFLSSFRPRQTQALFSCFKHT